MSTRTSKAQGVGQTTLVASDGPPELASEHPPAEHPARCAEIAVAGGSLVPQTVAQTCAPLVAAESPSRLAVFIAATCAVLRQAARVGWLAREVVDGTRGLQRLAQKLRKESGGLTVAIEADRFRHIETGQTMPLSGKAVIQLHRYCRRLGLAEVSVGPGLQPLALKELFVALLGPRHPLDLAKMAALGLHLKYDGGRSTLHLASGVEPAGKGAPNDGVEPADVPACEDDLAPASHYPGRPVVSVDPLDLAARHAASPEAGGSGRGSVADQTRPSRRPAEAGSSPPGGIQIVTAPPRRFGRAEADNEREQNLQQMSDEDAAIRRAIAEMVTDQTGSDHQPAILVPLDALDQDDHIAFLLASLRQHDRYTFNHSCNVALLAVALARELGVSGDELRAFAAAALLHDIGKLYTPLSVLNKVGKFAPEEWRTMKRHPADGMEILDGAACGNHYSEQVTLLHHVAYNGEGYPSAAASKPDLFAHVIQAADVYDAFTTVRPYRQQARPREVLEVMRRGAGSQFNPTVVQAMIRLMGETPIGSVLKLDNGQLGLVIDTGRPQQGRPIVRIIQDEEGRRPAQPVLLDLALRMPDGGEYMVDVVEAVDPLIRNIPIGRYI